MPVLLNLLLCLAAIAPAFAVETAAAERAFTRFPITVPEGWHYHEQIKDGVQSCFVSKEDIAATGAFSTGVSVFVIERVKERLKMNGATYVLAQASQAFAKPGLVFSDFQSRMVSHGLNAMYKYIDQSQPEALIEVFTVLIDDAKNDQVITVVCEAPKGEFDAMMEHANGMLKAIDVK